MNWSARSSTDSDRRAEAVGDIPGDKSGVRTKPELLAPAGDRTCLLAAVENGADAVYFGLQRHNARIRAHNFDGSDLPEVMTLLHRRGVRGYMTLNTLAFPGELADLEVTVRELAAGGVDAVIVQDLGLARLIHAIAPELEIHASTQMSITSEEGVALARELGCTRVILARELALTEIGRIRRAIDFPVEVFVHGALCVAYSGQCLTSEALGGRSANRGECAQACRMPYEIVCDGQLVDLENVQYLLSPQDLAAYDLIPQLIQLGVASLKIEGRLKTAEYVANITRHYREAIDAAWAGRPIGLRRATSRKCSSHSRADSPTGFWTGITTKSSSVVTMPRNGGSGSASWNRSRAPGYSSRSRRQSSRATDLYSTAMTRPVAPSKAGGSTRHPRSIRRRARRTDGAERSRTVGSCRAAIRSRCDRPPPARSRPAGLEDRRPRAHPPAPPLV